MIEIYGMALAMCAIFFLVVGDIFLTFASANLALVCFIAKVKEERCKA